MIGVLMSTHKIEKKTEITEKGEETKIYLDDECIYTVDKTLYAGTVRKNCEPEICKLLEQKLGRPITPRQLSMAFILETISDDPEE